MNSSASAKQKQKQNKKSMEKDGRFSLSME